MCMYMTGPASASALHTWSRLGPFQSFLNLSNAAAAARACRIPILHIDADPPFGGAERLREYCSQLVAERTPGAGHFHQLEAPERVNEILDRFIANLPP